MEDEEESFLVPNLLESSVEWLLDEYGLKFDHYCAALKIKILEKALVAESGVGHPDVVLFELSELEERGEDELESYNQYLIDLAKCIERLADIRAHLSDTQCARLRLMLASGNTTKADQLLAEIEASSDNPILLAEVAYQRGQLADDEACYLEAYAHYQRAVQHVPNNSLYLIQAGILAYFLDQRDQAMMYFTRALTAYPETERAEDSDLASACTYIGMMWEDAGEYDNAIRYYEQAHNIYNQELGENHPDTQSVLADIESAKAKRTATAHP